MDGLGDFAHVTLGSEVSEHVDGYASLAGLFCVGNDIGLGRRPRPDLVPQGPLVGNETGVGTRSGPELVPQPLVPDSVPVRQAQVFLDRRLNRRHEITRSWPDSPPAEVEEMLGVELPSEWELTGRP